MNETNGQDQPQKQDLIESAGNPTPMELSQDEQRFLVQAEKLKLAVKAVDTLICAAIGTRCNPIDFVRHSDKSGQKETFYLQATGLRKVRAFFGIYFRDREIIVEQLGKDTNGYDHFLYEVTGKAGSQVLDRMMGTDAQGGTQLDVYGSRSSKDGFFNKNDREPEQSDVRKAAISNWEARAIAGLLGLQNLNRDDLKKFGIDVAKVPGVEYQTGSEGGGNTNLISEAQGKRLYAIGRTAKVEDADARALLRAYGFERSTNITRDKYEEICKTVEGGSEKVKAKIAELAKAKPAPAPEREAGDDEPSFG